MNHIKLYSILFEAEETAALINPNGIAKSITDILEPKLEKGFEKLGNSLEKQYKEVSTKSLSTTGAKPAGGSRESTTNEKIDQIKQGIDNLQTSSAESAESAETIINTLKDTLKDKKK